jgi:Tfp pilus assembly protein PilX
MSMQKYRTPLRQGGVALVTALLLLLVATMLAATMFRSFGTQEKIAGNLREKQRALHAAEVAQQYAEWWLQSGSAPAKATCKAFVDIAAGGQVCSSQLAPSLVPTLSWPAGVYYVPPDASSTSGANMNVTTASGSGTYYQKPIFYIWDTGPGLGGEVYQVDAMGVGGSSLNGTPNAVAIVESIYVVTNAGHCGDPLAIC